MNQEARKLVFYTLIVIFQIIRSILVRDRKNCPLGFESNFAQLLADLMDVKFSGQVRQEQELLSRIPLKKRARASSSPLGSGSFGCGGGNAADSPVVAAVAAVNGASGGGLSDYLDELTTYPASFLEFQRIM